MSTQPVDTSKGSVLDQLTRIAIAYEREKLMAKIVSAAPLLFGQTLGWLTNPIASFFVDQILSYLLERGIYALAILWIAVDVQQDVVTADQAGARLKAILENPAAYSVQMQKEVERDFDEEAIGLIRIGLGRLS